jgi:hypothetical protein
MAGKDKSTPMFVWDHGSPDVRELVDEMMDAVVGRGPVWAVDLANAAFSIMCHALAKMPDIIERDELLDDFAKTARKTVLADIGAIEHAGKEAKNH